MCSVLIFGGTTEGRILWEYCIQEAIPVEMFVATEYGAQVLEKYSTEKKHIHVGRMNCRDMISLFEAGGDVLVADATHPYAAEVTKNIQEACRAASKPRLRVNRESCMEEVCEGAYEETVIRVGSVAQAAEYLKDQTGNILVTTGSKEIERYTVIPDFRERLYVRILPNPDMLRHCLTIGIEGNHLIGMQGPFSKEMNCAMIKEYGIRWLVTKDSGTQGGFLEKFLASKQTGIRCMIVERSRDLCADSGSIELQEAKRRIKEWYFNGQKYNHSRNRNGESGSSHKGDKVCVDRR